MSVCWIRQFCKTAGIWQWMSPVGGCATLALAVMAPLPGYLTCSSQCSSGSRWEARTCTTSCHTSISHTSHVTWSSHSHMPQVGGQNLHHIMSHATWFHRLTSLCMSSACERDPRHTTSGRQLIAGHSAVEKHTSHSCRWLAACPELCGCQPGCYQQLRCSSWFP
jgi:hypothetical protein